MKRDMEIARKLLLLIEEQDDDSKELIIPQDIDRKVAVYHLNLLDQAGFTDSTIRYADNSPMWIYSSITWDGHEFLDAVKNETIWNKIKTNVAEKGGSIPFDVLKLLAVDYAKKLFIG